MRKLARVLIVIFLVIMTVSLFTGCQNSGKQTAEPSSQQSTAAVSNTQREANLRFLWWGADDRHQATLAAIDLFTKQNPNIKIQGEYTGFDGYYQKLVTQLAGGTAPDIIQVGTTMMPELVAQGDFFVDMDSVKDIIDTSIFDKSLLDTCIFNGKLICLPTGVGTRNLIYNKDFFEKYGIPLDTVWTWDNLLSIGSELHKKDKNIYFYFAGAGGFNEMLQMYIIQKTNNQWVNDDYTIGFTREDLVDAFSYLRKLIDNGVVAPAEERAVYTEGNQDPRWAKGEFGIIIDVASWIEAAQNSVSVELGVARVPMHPDAKCSGFNVGAPSFIAINKKSAFVDEAAKFVNFFFTDKDAILALGTTRSIPATERGRQILSEVGKMNPKVAEAIKIGVVNPAPVPNILSTNAELLAIYNDIEKEVEFGKITPEAAADKLIKAYEEKLAELKSKK